MPGDDNDLFRMFTSPDVGNHIRARRLGVLTGGQYQVHFDAATRGQPLYQLGILGSHRPRGNGRIGAPAGVRNAKLAISGGANQSGGGSQPEAASAPTPR